MYEAVVLVELQSHRLAAFVSLLNNIFLFKSICRTATDCTNRANTFTHIHYHPYITQKRLAQRGSDAYRQKYKSIQNLCTRRLTLKPSCLRSSVGLTGTFLVSVELCACLWAELTQRAQEFLFFENGSRENRMKHEEVETSLCAAIIIKKQLLWVSSFCTFHCNL